MKTIMIPNEYTNTLQGFVDWFTDEFKPTEKDNQTALNHLTEKLDGVETSIKITEPEIWFLKNYLQSAWQDDSCTVNRKDLRELFNYIVEKENE